MSYDDSALVTPHNAPFPTCKAALTYGLPSCYAFRETVQAGGLVSLGPDRVWMAKQAADYKIIRGAKPENCQSNNPIATNCTSI
jgi:putative tryptophan/tyrosine transport system substrate-binding protein